MTLNGAVVNVYTNTQTNIDDVIAYKCNVCSLDNIKQEYLIEHSKSAKHVGRMDGISTVHDNE